RQLVTAEARPVGTRVLLSRLFPEVTRMLTRSRRRSYPRAQFAFDLARLRRERHLHHDGLRIDLEVATGGAAVQRRTVVWLEDEVGTRHHYLYFPLLPGKERVRDAAKPVP